MRPHRPALINRLHCLRHSSMPVVVSRARMHRPVILQSARASCQGPVSRARTRTHTTTTTGDEQEWMMIKDMGQRLLFPDAFRRCVLATHRTIVVASAVSRHGERAVPAGVRRPNRDDRQRAQPMSAGPLALYPIRPRAPTGAPLHAHEGQVSALSKTCTYPSI